jgi:hypothetical protein
LGKRASSPKFGHTDRPTNATAPHIGQKYADFGLFGSQMEPFHGQTVDFQAKGFMSKSMSVHCTISSSCRLPRTKRTLDGEFPAQLRREFSATNLLHTGTAARYCRTYSI